MKEKRRFIRFAVSLKTTYAPLTDPKTEKTGVTKDISAGGIQLITDEKLETGKKVTLDLFVPDALNPAHLTGRVLWSTETASGSKPSFACGIEFMQIEEDNKNTFLKFLCGLMSERRDASERSPE